MGQWGFCTLQVESCRFRRQRVWGRLLEPPSAAVCAFINAYIESIDVLRVLLHLARHPDKAWTIGDISKATALPVESVSAQIPKLVAAGLVVNANEGDIAGFKYGPRATEFEQMVQELIQLDDQMPVTLIRLVYARKSGSVQAFADAFRLRRP